MTQLEMNLCSQDYTLKEVLLEALMDDAEYRTKDEERVLARYMAFKEEDRRLVNDIFISLCGWALDTMIHAAKHNVTTAAASDEVLIRGEEGRPPWD